MVERGDGHIVPAGQKYRGHAADFATRNAGGIMSKESRTERSKKEIKDAGLSFP
jgi:hypothetical protein